MEILSTTDACTMPVAQRPLRLAEFDALFASTACSVAWDGDRVQIHLAGSPGLLERARDLTERETACCSFFTFDVVGDDDDVSISVSVPAERLDLLRALADRAVGLSG